MVLWLDHVAAVFLKLLGAVAIIGVLGVLIVVLCWLFVEAVQARAWITKLAFATLMIVSASVVLGTLALSTQGAS